MPDDPGPSSQQPLSASADTEDEGTNDEHPYAHGVNEILTAVANVIEKERFVDALSQWVDAHSAKVKTTDKYQWRALIMSVTFSVAVFFGISVLAWNGKIPKDASTTLFGSLIGYWFGRHQKKD
jgi:hypothetical protein